MTDAFTDTREERRSRLDEFAARPEQSAGDLVPAPAPPPLAMFAPLPPVGQRDEGKVLQKIKVLAAAAGEDWYYRYPVQNRKQNRTDWIEGPSIKLANDIARLYGNCDVDVRYLDLGSVFSFYARFVDRESGFSLTRPFQQNKAAARIGGDDNARREDIALQIGTSKAERNVVVNALQTFADFAFEEAKQALVDKVGRDIERWRTRTIERISAKVDLKRVEAVIGRTTDKWLAPDIARVIAMGKACEDGMATWDETFPKLGHAGAVPHDPDTGEVLDKFADERKQFDAAQGVEQAAAAAGESPPSDPAAAADDRPEIIDRLLRLAAEKKPAQDRLESLDVAATMLGDLYPTHAEFLTQAVAVTKTVINGEETPAKARKYLEGLVR